MESQLSEVIAVILIWVAREIIGSMTTSKSLKKIVEENSKHIEENKTLLAKIKNRVN